MTKPTYATHRSHFHLIGAGFLLIAGGIGLYLLNDLIAEVQSRPARILVELGPFAMPFSLLMVPVLLVLEMMNRRGKWMLPEKYGGIILVVLLTALTMGGQAVSLSRFKGWLGSQGYERCEAFDKHTNSSASRSGGGRTFEAWVQKGACEKYSPRAVQP